METLSPNRSIYPPSGPSLHFGVLEVGFRFDHVDGNYLIEISFADPSIGLDLMIGLHTRRHEMVRILGIRQEAAHLGHVALTESRRQRSLEQDDDVVLEVGHDEFVLQRPFFHSDTSMFNDALELESLLR